jgi:hypothetical protein
MRDVSLYPFPNNYNMFLGRKYQNIECIKFILLFQLTTQPAEYLPVTQLAQTEAPAKDIFPFK